MRDHVYVFVILNSPTRNEDFYIVPPNLILDDVDHFFGSSYRRDTPSSMPAINLGPLAPYRDKWQVFDQPTPIGEPRPAPGS